MDKNASVPWKIAKYMRFHFVFLHLVVVSGTPPVCEPPAPLHHTAPAQKISRLQRTLLVRRPEYHAVPKVQSEHPRFVPAKRRDKGGRRLHGCNHRRTCLTDDIDRIVVAHTVFARRHEALRFVCPQNKQIVPRPLTTPPVETSKQAMDDCIFSIESVP